MRLAPHPDRLFPADPATRTIARALHATVAEAPIVSPHGHVPAELLLHDAPFSDPAGLLITPDHYVTRLLHASGVPLELLGVGAHPADPREVWRLFSARWNDFLGTPVRFWLEAELAEVFGIDEQPSAANADRVYDALAARLAEPSFRPRALFDRFRLDVLATTDDPADDLSAHRALAADPSFGGRVLPTLRADGYMNPADPAWPARLDRLAEASGVDCGTHAGLLDALRARRAFAKSLGSTATDCGAVDAWAEPLDAPEAERIHREGLAGTASAADAAAYRRDLLYRFAEMAADDGLVMQLHTGVLRNHHAATLDRYGPDTGHDLPVASTFVEPLRRMLNDFGTNPAFRIVLFTVDETTFSREIAPLAGFYPSVYVGAPWWFLDAPAAIGRFRAAATETAGFRKTSGFIDDTRAFCSIPARHDMSRRADAAYLAGLVTTHQIDEADAHSLALDLVSAIPRETFRLGPESAP